MRRDDDTADQLPCELNPDMWFPEGTTRDALLTAELAMLRCLECPALRACAEHVATMRPKPSSGVWAGQNYNPEQVKR